ncbi:MAG: hypothetical protein A2176_09655 [Spirochaetes bacterium RBG_13_51_14]|nr:MAG: hypothetical protein A2176_09655 [Spirochaetes bacterium RBG_13_51_14]
MAECCSGGVRIIYSCSGAADVGEIADRVVRKLRDDGFAKMACLAGVGAGLSGYVQSAKGADVVFTVDGCPTACVKKNIERIVVNPVSYILTEMGLEKGNTPVSDALVTDIAEKIKSGASVRPAAGVVSGGCGCGGNC